MCPKCVLSSPFQSYSVTYTRDRCAYVVDLLLAPVESTAFGRQGPEVQILSPRPFNSPISVVLACLHASDALCLLPFGTNLAHGGIMATIKKRGNRYHVQIRRRVKPSSAQRPSPVSYHSHQCSASLYLNADDGQVPVSHAR